MISQLGSKRYTFSESIVLKIRNGVDIPLVIEKNPQNRCGVKIKFLKIRIYNVLVYAFDSIRHIAITICPFRFAFSHLPRYGQLVRQKHRKNFTWKAISHITLNPSRRCLTCGAKWTFCRTGPKNLWMF